MRKIFAKYLSDMVAEDQKTVFLTGDLGFNAFEGLREKMKERFINAGVAEQSMVSVAAGLAYQGYQVFCYSIAPFIIYKCLEQIRNDVCFHHLPVYLVGNGGGYGYGIMGSTHHALEDIALVSGLPDMHCYIPSFAEDIEPCLHDIMTRRGPAYLRLGLAQPNPFFPVSFDFFKYLNQAKNRRVTLAGTGTVLKAVFQAIDQHNLTESVDVFDIIKLPYPKFPPGFIASIQATRRLIVLEEHVRIGGLGQRLAHDILQAGIHLDRFQTVCAVGYPGSRYGSQEFHLKKSGLDKDSIFKFINIFINERVLLQQNH